MWSDTASWSLISVGLWAWLEGRAGENTGIGATEGELRRIARGPSRRIDSVLDIE
ncbi:hypothetical protein [Methanopyrus sp.]